MGELRSAKNLAKPRPHNRHSRYGLTGIAKRTMRHSEEASATEESLQP